MKSVRSIGYGFLAVFAFVVLICSERVFRDPRCLEYLTVTSIGGCAADGWCGAVMKGRRYDIEIERTGHAYLPVIGAKVCASTTTGFAETARYGRGSSPSTLFKLAVLPFTAWREFSGD